MVLLIWSVICRTLSELLLLAKLYVVLGASSYDGCSDGGNCANAATAKAVSKMHAFHAILLAVTLSLEL